MSRFFFRAAICVMTSLIVFSEAMASDLLVDMVVGETQVYPQKGYTLVAVCLSPIADETAKLKLSNRNSVNGVHTIYAGSTTEFAGRVIRCGQKQVSDIGFSLDLGCVTNSSAAWYSAAAYTNHSVPLQENEVTDGKLTNAGYARMVPICRGVGRVVNSFKVRNLVN